MNFKDNLNEHTLSYVISSLNTSASVTHSDQPRTELDSHANMVVLGKHCFVFEKTGKHCEVSAFTPDIPPMKLPIVDAVITYDCPFKLTSYLLMIRNAIYSESMTHNLLPPFVLREANIHVDECAKIHSLTPTINNMFSLPCISYRWPRPLGIRRPRYAGWLD